MRFTKMHGCGNDYIYINGFEVKIPPEEKQKLAVSLSDRHFGIGSDGVIFVNPSQTADFQMEMYNADGSRAEMCGNGIRCVGKYIYDEGLSGKTAITVESCGKVKYLEMATDGRQVVSVKVDMGSPRFRTADTKELTPKPPSDYETIVAGGKAYPMTYVSMGNPHAVIVMPAATKLDSLDLPRLGPALENHEWFPERINTEFIKVIDRQTIQMRVWERGSGETLACGTGSCAAVAACIGHGLTDEEVTVRLRGGEVAVRWIREEDRLILTGPAVTVFKGEIKIPIPIL